MNRCLFIMAFRCLPLCLLSETGRSFASQNATVFVCLVATVGVPINILSRLLVGAADASTDYKGSHWNEASYVWTTMGGATAVVSELYVYPVKSCKGIAVSSAYLSSTGFEWDRQWVVVNAKGRFIMQRQEPKMALIEVFLPAQALEHNWQPLPADSVLSFKAPGMEPLHILLVPPYPREKVPAAVWEWSGLTYDEGSTAAEWFSSYLGKAGIRLVRFDTVGENRPTDPQYASGYKTAFSDGYPILLISQPSLDALNERLPESMHMNRFRPNIVVKGCEAFAEDLWKKFRIGDVNFQGVKLCSRCKITTTNQETAEVGKEPLAILRSFRVGQLLSSAPHMKGQVFFGQNVVYDITDESEATVNIGDEVHVIQS